VWTGRWISDTESSMLLYYTVCIESDLRVNFVNRNVVPGVESQFLAGRRSEQGDCGDCGEPGNPDSQKSARCVNLSLLLSGGASIQTYEV